MSVALSISLLFILLVQFVTLAQFFDITLLSILFEAAVAADLF